MFVFAAVWSGERLFVDARGSRSGESRSKDGFAAAAAANKNTSGTKADFARMAIHGEPYKQSQEQSGGTNSSYTLQM